MTDDSTTIRVRGARRHNLRGVDLDLPRRGLTVLVGPSGSGKTSLALDTVHATARARLSQALGAPAAADADLSVVGDLPLTLAASDRHLPPAGHRVVEVLGILPEVLRFARLAGVQHCPRCDRPLPVTGADRIVQTLLREADGRRLVVLAPLARGRRAGIGRLIDEVARQGFTRVRLDGELRRIEEIGPVDGRRPHDVDVVVDRVRVRADRAERIEEAVGVALTAGQGRLLAVADDRTLSLAERPWCPDHPDLALEPMRDEWLGLGAKAGCPRCRGTGRVEGGAPCPRCDGIGLRPEVAHWRLRGHDRAWPAWFDLPVEELPGQLASILGPDAPDGLVEGLEITASLCRRAGIGGLAIGRRSGDLSTTERRRLMLVSTLRLAMRMPGAMLVADEPLAGLDATTGRQVEDLLAEAGVPVLAVTHRRSLVDRADHCVAFGPGAGHAGGRVVWQGPGSALPAALLPSPPTPPPDGVEPDAPGKPRSGAGRRATGGDGGDRMIDLVVAGSPPLRLARGAINALTAPPAGGKTRWLQLLLGALQEAVRGDPAGSEGIAVEGAADISAVLRFDRSPLGRNPRSCVATALGVWSPLRSLLAATRTARIQGVDAARFRFDQPGGRCEACQGSGADPERPGEPCPECGGRRFQRDILRVRLKGRTVAELLDSDIATAGELFAAHPRIGPALQAAALVGLGYLPLGQASGTLSGGEAQRLRLARELARAGSMGDDVRRLDDRVIVLDAPDVGLHPHDLEPVVEVLRRLADRGATVVVATVDAALLAAADRVVQLSSPPPPPR